MGWFDFRIVMAISKRADRPSSLRHISRPVGITVAKDGALLVSEDGDKTIWRVTYGR